MGVHGPAAERVESPAAERVESPAAERVEPCSPSPNELTSHAASTVWDDPKGPRCEH